MTISLFTLCPSSLSGSFIYNLLITHRKNLSAKLDHKEVNIKKSKI